MEMNQEYTIKFYFYNNPEIEQEIRELGEILDWNQDPLMSYIKIKTTDCETHRKLFKKYKEIRSIELNRIEKDND